MSILLTSPGLLSRSGRPGATAGRGCSPGAFVAHPASPVLLYYGGGWLQYGYRYALDAIPFAMALGGDGGGAERRDRLRLAGR